MKKTNAADALAFYSWCINFTAELASTFGDDPGSSIDPALYDSLKAVQLELDRSYRVELMDANGVVHAEVEKIIHISRR